MTDPSPSVPNRFARPALIVLALSAFVLAVTPEVRAGPGDSVTFDNQLRTGVRHLADAQNAYIRGDIRTQHTLARQAEEVFVQLARSQPRDLRPYLFGTQAAAFRGDVNAAWAWVQQYQARTPYGENDPDLHYIRAFVYVLAAGLPGTAVKALNTMMAVNPNARPSERDTLLYMARMDLGNQLMYGRSYDASIKEFQEAARLSRRHGWLRKELAALGSSGIAMRVGTMWKSAEGVFAHLMERDPKNILWHWHMGLTHASQLKFAEAIPYYHTVRAMRAKGEFQAAHRQDIDSVFLRLGNCHRNLAGTTQVTPDEREVQFNLAEENLLEYVKLIPGDARGHKWLGHLHYPDRDDPYGAIPHFEKAFALDPNCDSSLRALVQIFERYPPPPKEGESAEAAAKRLEAWKTRRDAMKKDLEENREKRQKVLDERELASVEDDHGCE